MTKTLLVLRHAKSSHKHPELGDHERPLNRRGQQAAPRMGRLLRDEGLIPEAIISSTAVRARATAEAVAEACGFAGDISLRRELYLAPPAVYLHVLRELPAELDTVLVVGHNPGAERLVSRLAGSEQILQTAALARIGLDTARWAELDWGTASRLLQLWRPRELG